MSAQQVKITSDQAAAVDVEYHWIPIKEWKPPVGPKLQLINRPYGVATYGSWSPDDGWTHWAPLPTFKKDAA